MNTEDTFWLVNCRGKAVKIVSPLLEHLPEDNLYKVVFVKRDIMEILASQRKMLARSGQRDTDKDDIEMSHIFEIHLKYIEKWMQQRYKTINVLYVRYLDFIEDKTAGAKRLNSFLGGRLDEKNMARVVDKTLYRQCRGRLHTQQ